MTEDSPNLETVQLERKKWEAETAYLEREVSVQEREQATREAELELKRKEQARSGWRNPLVVAIIAATIAAAGNAVVTVVNGILQRQIEDQKSEQTRILEMIKTGDPDKAADNLQFLLEAGLITNPDRVVKLRDFLAKREPGSGPTLPTQPALSGFIGSIVGADDAVVVDALPPHSGIHDVARAVGQLRVIKENRQFQCTSFLVANDLALTAGFCVDGAAAAQLLMRDDDQEILYEVKLPPVEISSKAEELNYALLRIKGEPGLKHGVLSLEPKPPVKDQMLMIVMFRGSKDKLAVIGAPECRVLAVEEYVFHHLCDTGGGSSGAPILTADSGHVLGMHFQRGRLGGVAVRGDAVMRSSKTLQTGR